MRRSPGGDDRTMALTDTTPAGRVRVHVKRYTPLSTIAHEAVHAALWILWDRGIAVSPTPRRPGVPRRARHGPDPASAARRGEREGPRRGTVSMRRIIFALVLLLAAACTPNRGASSWPSTTSGPGPRLPSCSGTRRLGDIAQAYADKLSYANFPLAHNPFLAQELNHTGIPWIAAGRTSGAGPPSSGSSPHTCSPRARPQHPGGAWDLVGTGVSTRDGKTCTVHVYVDL